jgi:hypothetical protein
MTCCRTIGRQVVGISPMSICIAVALSSTILARLPDRFTLAWEHTVEKVRWEEDYVAANGMLVLREARIQGTGAGMEMPPDAELADGAWRYRPDLPALPKVYLRNLELPLGYDVCWGGRCRRLRTLIGSRDDLLTLAACPGSTGGFDWNDASHRGDADVGRGRKIPR